MLTWVIISEIKVDKVETWKLNDMPNSCKFGFRKSILFEYRIIQCFRIEHFFCMIRLQLIRKQYMFYRCEMNGFSLFLISTKYRLYFGFKLQGKSLNTFFGHELLSLLFIVSENKVKFNLCHIKRLQCKKLPLIK